MNKRTITKVLTVLMISSMLTGCGGKKVTEAYSQYISQAKVEIVNGDYDKALQFLTLAKDENTSDKVVDELNEQIEMYRKLEKWQWTIEDGNLTDDLYKSIEEQIAEANKFIERKFESNLMIENIKSKIEEISFGLEEDKKMKQEALEKDKIIQEEIENSSNIALAIYDDLDNKRFEEANNKSYELETSLKTLDSYEDNFERNRPLYSLALNSRKIFNGINKFNSEKEKDAKFYDDLLKELKSIEEQQGAGQLFAELLTGDGNDGYHYHAIFKRSSGNYIKYYRHVKGIYDFGFTNTDEKSNLVDIIDMVNGDNILQQESVEWDPSWNTKADGFYEETNNN